MMRSHPVLPRWFPVCVVLSGLDPNTEFAKIQIWFSGNLVKVSEFTTILDPEKDGQGILILAQEQGEFLTLGANIIISYFRLLRRGFR